MNSESRLTDLIMRYLDGRLMGDETEELNARLRVSPAGRSLLWEIARQATAMGDLARAEPTTCPSARLQLRRRRVDHRLRWGMAISLLLLVAAGGLAMWFHARASDQLIVVTEVIGETTWSSNAQSRSTLQVGDRLESGTFAVEANTGSLGLRLADGTQLTLGGGSEFTVAAAGQKRLRLRQGNLFAVVAPQPPSRPMLVQTPSAEIQVIGTVFSLNAQAENTVVNVEEGRVMLRRLADGQTVNVSSREAAAASFDAALPLGAISTQSPPSVWRLDLSAPPGPGGTGQWLPGRDGDPSRLRARPTPTGKRGRDILIIFFGVSVRDNSVYQGGLVSLASDSVLHLRYRTAKPTGVEVFLSTHRADGSFGGNFATHIPPPQGPGGWRSVDLRLADFKPRQPDRAKAPDGLRAFLVLVNTATRDVGLEIAALSIRSPPRAVREGAAKILTFTTIPVSEGQGDP
jgi:ferric-dicitrate binding protein FerR (iron transport regulator)